MSREAEYITLLNLTPLPLEMNGCDFSHGVSYGHVCCPFSIRAVSFKLAWA
jgi:hypothetical protein